MRLVLLLAMLLSLPDGAFAVGRDAACVRLGGWIGQRAEALVRARLSGPEAMGPIFDEAVG